MPIAAVRDGETLPQTLEELFREHAQMIKGRFLADRCRDRPMIRAAVRVRRINIPRQQ